VLRFLSGELNSMVTAIVAGYLLGSIPFALFAARRWSGADLRRAGSGNLGATNVMRVSGVSAGLVVAALDMAKGAVGVLMAERLSGNDAAPAMAAVAAVVGHVYPVWLRFRGGKGVATAFGAFATLTPFAAVPALAVFVVAASATKYISIGSVLASLSLPPLAYFLGSAPAVVIAATATAVLIVFRHRTNLDRVRTGTERRLGARV
jgi:acyl phosphate:glycerol-3-phosphate acyltransferase